MVLVRKIACCCMRGILLLCLAGAATSFVWESRQLAVLQPPAMVKAAERVVILKARTDSGYTPRGEDTPLTPEEFAEHHGFPADWRAYASTNGKQFEGVSVLIPGDDKKPYLSLIHI